MDIRVSVSPYEDKKANLIGYATVVFDEQYSLENVKIRTGKNGRYVELPRFSVPKKNENGEIEKDIYGKPEFEYKDILHPFKAGDDNQKFREMILTEYKRVTDAGGRANAYKEQEQAGTVYKMDNVFTVSKTTAGVHNPKNDNDYLRGIATVSFGDTFMLEKVKINESKDGNLYMDLPKYRTVAKDENGQVIKDDKGQPEFEYRDAFHPITKEAYAELNNAVMQAFNDRVVAKQNDKQTELSQEGIPFEVDDFEDIELTGGRK